MSIYDYEPKSYDEHAEFSYYSRAADGDIIRVERRLEEPGFDKLVEAFLDWAASVYQWDRKDIKSKAFESVAEWEV